MCQHFPSSENSQFTGPQQDPAEKNPASTFEISSQSEVLDCKDFPCVSHVRSLMFSLS